MAKRALTKQEVAEMDALDETVRAIGRPTFIHRHNWHNGYRLLVRRGLVTWLPHPKMGPDFRSVKLTQKGRKLLAAHKKAAA